MALNIPEMVDSLIIILSFVRFGTWIPSILKTPHHLLQKDTIFQNMNNCASFSSNRNQFNCMLAKFLLSTNQTLVFIMLREIINSVYSQPKYELLT